MKKILLVDSSPRRNGNSNMIIDWIAEDLKAEDVSVFKMREKECKPCLACGACQKRENQKCVQNDDLSKLLSVVNECDAIVLATPIYNHQINSQAKLFIERMYPFFNLEKRNMSNTTKFGKKAALICSCWAGPKEVYEKYARWTVRSFSQIGAEETRALVFDQIPNAGDIAKRKDYREIIHQVSNWIVE